MKSTLLLLLPSLLLPSCSSIKTTTDEKPQLATGLVYYLPQQDFMVTIKVASARVTEVSAATAPAYPDYSKRYVASFSHNYLGKGTLNIGVNEKGLLTSVNSKTESKVGETLVNIASSLASGAPVWGGRTSAESKAPNLKECSQDGTYTLFLKTNAESGTRCGIKFIPKKVVVTPRMSLDSIEPNRESTSGIYYRQQAPYLIEGRGDGVVLDLLVFSSSDEPAHFLPVIKTFFADNKADITFNEGVLKTYNQEADSELASLVKIPADVISAYFTAVSGIFEKIGDASQKEATALSNSLTLEKEQIKYEACIAALKVGDAAAAEKLGC